MPRRLISALLIFAFFVFIPATSSAKARVVVVFILRSTPALSSQASTVTKAIADRIAAIPGFDAQILPTPMSGTLGVAAATAGAEIYVVGAMSDDGTGLSVTLSSFDSSNDVIRASTKTKLTALGSLPADADFASLIQLMPPATPAPVPTPANLISGLALGTPISIFLDSAISSRGASAGQTFSFHAAQDVYAVDGLHVSIMKGAPGAGEIQTVAAAAGNGSGGKINLQFDWIVATDGTKVPLTNAQTSTEGGDSKGASSTATIATYLLLGPLGFFAHNFVRGKDAQITTTTPLTAYVDRGVRPGPVSTLPPAGGPAPSAAPVPPYAVPAGK